MNKIVENLLLLNNLELGGQKDSAECKALRLKVPAPELKQYDRLRTRGKKGVALVQNGVCTACHIRMPMAKINSLIQCTGSLTCDNCGCFIFLSPEQQDLFVHGERGLAIA